MKVTILVSPLCDSSLEAAKLLRRFCEERGLEYEEVSVRTMEGQKMALQAGVKLLPALLIDGKLVHQGPISEEALRRIVRQAEEGVRL